jgi:hypothetical protein
MFNTFLKQSGFCSPNGRNLERNPPTQFPQHFNKFSTNFQQHLRRNTDGKPCVCSGIREFQHFCSTHFQHMFNICFSGFFPKFGQQRPTHRLNHSSSKQNLKICAVHPRLGSSASLPKAPCIELPHAVQHSEGNASASRHPCLDRAPCDAKAKKTQPFMSSSCAL